MLKKLTTYFRFLLVVVITLFISVSSFSQLKIPPKPTVQTSVYDEAKILSGYERNALEQKLISYADTTSTQIVVATINSLNGEDIAFYAAQWADKWGVGQKKEDNGIFILVAKKDRKITIQTGYGVEHLLTDALSKRIITNIITPEFRKGNFYGGLDRATSAIMQIMSGEYEGQPQKKRGGGELLTIWAILFFFILMIILSNRNKGKGGRNRRTGSLLDAIILSNAGRGGFSGGGGFGGSSGGGSFGGGGFGGGFGGGGFGGGGASGGW